MGATFVVTLREGFEAALLLGIVYAYLEQIGERRHWRWVTVGGALGLAASLAMGVGVSLASGPLLDLGPDLVTVGVIFLTVGLLTWHGWWMRTHARRLRADLQRRVKEAEAARRLWLVGLIAFSGVFREGAETLLFLWGLMAQADVAGWGGILGGVLGVAVAAGLGWALFRGGRRMSVQGFFLATSTVLLLVAAGLFSTGLGKLQALGILPAGDMLWDSSALLDDHGGVGGFLAALVGYRAQPSALEIAGYAGYLLVGGILFFGGRRPRPQRRPLEPSPSSSTRVPTP